MSGMDRLSDADVEWHAAHGAPLSAAMARELLAHRRASQAAPAPADGLREAVIEELYRELTQRHADYMSGKGRNPVDYSSPWSMAAEGLSGMTDMGIKPSPISKVILEHSGCGYSTQVEQLTVRLEPGDKVLLVKPARANPAPAQEGGE